MVWLCILLLGIMTMSKSTADSHHRNIRGLLFGHSENPREQPSSIDIRLPSINIGAAPNMQMAPDSMFNPDHFCQGPCLDSWIHYNGRCYLYVSTPSTKPEAERFCASAFNGAQLASIEDPFQNAFVVALAKSMNKQIDKFWTEQKMLTNQRGFIFGIGGCFSLGIGGLGLWGNTDCNNRFPFICSYTSSSAVPGEVKADQLG
ncbi:snaclec agglucetin subunit alpha-1 [Microcaecilia unicolor]|uniref:Snaclec agglucetin subunit alpha-1-like n=1 Tax=Microcaecilia unicolor TaxID=1415580 RepID=A0A6P7ZVY8_9AMPH|nr:snaclec agglucetin subunit alpha-1-like [Microcaecilia unicolor]XP_030077480.1 snaclec agglucetin subunit alpha-1-like [Microcaecilia unicolor]